MAEMSNIDHAKLENRQIFFHGDIDDYASVAFILSSILYKIVLAEGGCELATFRVTGGDNPIAPQSLVA